MTVLLDAMATRNRFLTTTQASERALTQAEFDRPATDSAPLFFFSPLGYRRHDPHLPPFCRRATSHV